MSNAPGGPSVDRAGSDWRVTSGAARDVRRWPVEETVDGVPNPGTVPSVRWVGGRRREHRVPGSGAFTFTFPVVVTGSDHEE
ncbi:hypothetical protein C1701_02330 [Actinoalloteichus sp. AHMU CJ021]|nr:hypothetical protein C1701_02330 [Actinoalloteichus sp. AHMU CJ021]